MIRSILIALIVFLALAAGNFIIQLDVDNFVWVEAVKRSLFHAEALIAYLLAMAIVNSG